MTDIPDDAIAKLYAVPLNSFTRERNALASALAKRNRAAEAKAVRQLRRPSAALWAANQLAHTDRERLDAYLEGVTEVRRSQLRDPRAAAEGLARQRRDLHHLVRRAGELLARHGSRATPDTLRRISDTLLGAAVDADRAGELRQGRLQQELAAPGFEVLSGGGRAGHLQLVRGGKSAPMDAPRAQREEPAHQRGHAAQQKEEAARQRRDAERARAEAAVRERKEAAAREREEAAARRREEAEARQREIVERRATIEQAEQEARDLGERLAAARRRLTELRRAAKSTPRRRPSS